MVSNHIFPGAGNGSLNLDLVKTNKVLDILPQVNPFSHPFDSDPGFAETFFTQSEKRDHVGDAVNRKFSECPSDIVLSRRPEVQDTGPDQGTDARDSLAPIAQQFHTLKTPSAKI